MVKGWRPKLRWAAGYLKKKFGPDGAPLPSSIRQATYFTQDQLLDPPFPKDEYYKENEKSFATGGPSLWISKLLQEKGPLTRREIWSTYVRDNSIDRADVKIESRLE
jgi:hypothetical protein